MYGSCVCIRNVSTAPGLHTPSPAPDNEVKAVETFRSGPGWREKLAIPARSYSGVPLSPRPHHAKGAVASYVVKRASTKTQPDADTEPSSPWILGPALADGARWCVECPLNRRQLHSGRGKISVRDLSDSPTS